MRAQKLPDGGRGQTFRRQVHTQAVRVRGYIEAVIDEQSAPCHTKSVGDLHELPGGRRSAANMQGDVSGARNGPRARFEIGEGENLVVGDCVQVGQHDD